MLLLVASMCILPLFFFDPSEGLNANPDPVMIYQINAGQYLSSMDSNAQQLAKRVDTLRDYPTLLNDDGWQRDLANAVNCVIRGKGGLAVVCGGEEAMLPLPVAGLMADEDGLTVARKYADLDAKAKGLGTTLRAPFMTLSFMALLVIPRLKLSDRGLFDGETFEFTPLFTDTGD